jgi:hypothetical protein
VKIIMLTRSELFNNTYLSFSELIAYYEKHKGFKAVIPKVIWNVFIMLITIYISITLPSQLNYYIDGIESENDQDENISNIFSYCLTMVLFSISKSFLQENTEFIADEFSSANYVMHIDRLNRLSLLQRGDRDIAFDHYNIQLSSNGIKAFLSVLMNALTNATNILASLKLGKLEDSKRLAIVLGFITLRFYGAYYRSNKLSTLRENVDSSAMQVSEDIDTTLRCYELIHNKNMLDKENLNLLSLFKAKNKASQNYSLMGSILDSINSVLYAATLGSLLIINYKNIKSADVGILIYCLSMLEKQFDEFSSLGQIAKESLQDFIKPISLLTIQSDLAEPKKARKLIHSIRLKLS